MVRFCLASVREWLILLCMAIVLFYAQKIAGLYFFCINVRRAKTFVFLGFYHGKVLAGIGNSTHRIENSIEEFHEAKKRMHNN